MSLKEGTVFAGRYEVIKALGSGAMGDVFLCRHVDLGRDYVIKVIKPEISKDDVMMQRFRNEVIAAFDVSHENVVRAYEFLNDGSLYGYTMEYVEGGDLLDKMTLNPKFDFKELLDLLNQICLGVQALHDNGIVHRDLKPENILLTKKGQVKISDFGIAIVGRNTRLTQHGGMLGSASYLAPEYVAHSKFDIRSDIYAIGVIAYEMLTGEDPFPADNVIDKLQMRVIKDPVPAQRLRPDAPDKLLMIVKKMMERSPRNRYQTCYDIVADISRIKDFGQIVDDADRKVARRNQTTSFDEELTRALNGAESSVSQQRANTQELQSDVIDLTKHPDTIKRKSETQEFSTTTFITRKQGTSPFFKAAMIFLALPVITTIGSLSYKYLIDSSGELDNLRSEIVEVLPLPDYAPFEVRHGEFISKGAIFKGNSKLELESLTIKPRANIVQGEELQIQEISLTKKILEQGSLEKGYVLGEMTVRALLNQSEIDFVREVRILFGQDLSGGIISVSVKLPKDLTDKIPRNKLIASYEKSTVNLQLNGHFKVSRKSLIK